MAVADPVMVNTRSELLAAALEAPPVGSGVEPGARPPHPDAAICKTISRVMIAIRDIEPPEENCDRSPEGKIMTWNAGAQNIKGYKASEIIGKHFSQFYTYEAKEGGWPDRELEIAASAGRFTDEGWRVRKDGPHFGPRL